MTYALRPIVLPALSLVLLVGPASSPAGAAEGPAGAAYGFLNLGASARIEGMGGAGTAMADPGDALSFNPALLSRARSRSAGASWYNWLDDVQGGWVSGVEPLGSRSAIGLGVRALSIGAIDNVPGEAKVDEGDLAVVAGWGHGVGPVDAGLGLRMIRSKLAEESGTGWSADAGLAYEWVEGWDLAAAVRNFGPAFGRGDLTSDQLPTRTAFGLGTKVGELRLGGEVLWENGPGWMSIVGAEWVWRDRLALRAGSHLEDTADDALEPWAAGLGIRVRNDLEVDYAFRDGLFDPSHRLGLRWSPGRPGGSAASPDVTSRREFYASVVSRAVEPELEVFPVESGRSIAVRPVQEHAAAGAVAEILAGLLRERGHVVQVLEPMPDLPDDLDEEARKRLEEAGVGKTIDPVLEFDIVTSTYEVLTRQRARWVGPETIERRAAVELDLELFLPEEDQSVWKRTVAAEDTESVVSSRVPDSAGYPAAVARGTGAGGKRKMSPLLEPVIVGGIVTGLAVIFFSNRDVGN